MPIDRTTYSRMRQGQRWLNEIEHTLVPHLDTVDKDDARAIERSSTNLRVRTRQWWADIWWEIVPGRLRITIMGDWSVADQDIRKELHRLGETVGHELGVALDNEIVLRRGATISNPLPGKKAGAKVRIAPSQLEVGAGRVKLSFGTPVDRRGNPK